MNYYDKWGRIHHKPCVNGEPSSGNAWLYTAYVVKLGLSVNEAEIAKCWTLCHIMRDGTNPLLLRSPGKETPPFSRDEFLGMNYLFSKAMRNYSSFYGWSFSPYPLPEFSITKLISQLWQLRPYIFQKFDKEKGYEFGLTIIWKTRNYFWQNNLDQLYRFAFSVPLQDRHFILKSWRKFQWYNPVHAFYAAVSFIDSKLPKKSGIKWVKYGGEGNLREMVKEFPVGHPIEKVVNGGI